MCVKIPVTYTTSLKITLSLCIVTLYEQGVGKTHVTLPFRACCIGLHYHNGVKLYLLMHLFVQTSVLDRRHNFHLRPQPNVRPWQTSLWHYHPWSLKPHLPQNSTDSLIFVILNTLHLHNLSYPKVKKIGWQRRPYVFASSFNFLTIFEESIHSDAARQKRKR